MVEKDLGAVSAYAYAVEQGYTGTESEFAVEIANSAENAKKAQEAKEAIYGMTASATTLAAGSEATASFNQSTKVLSLGIPHGEKGETGATGPQGPQGEKGDTYTITESDYQAIADKVETEYTEELQEIKKDLSGLQATALYVDTEGFICLKESD